MKLLNLFENAANQPSQSVPNEDQPVQETVYNWAKRTGAAPFVIPYNVKETEPPHYKFECVPYTRSDGTQRYVYGAPSSSTSLRNTNLPREWYTSMQELLNHPGVYSWILFLQGDKELFIAAKTLTPAELMSKHKNIQREYQGAQIIAAGECAISADRAVTYNFLSGTYMLPIMDLFKRAFGPKDYRPVYRARLTPLWQEAGATSVTYTDDPLLPTDMTRNSPLALYTQLGYEFESFPSKEECMRYAYAKNEEQTGGGKRKRKRTYHRRRKAYPRRKTYRKRK